MIFVHRVNRWSQPPYDLFKCKRCGTSVQRPVPESPSTRSYRAMLERHLAQAEQHVALGEQHVARQRALVAELERDGHNTQPSRDLLKQFEQMQKLHIANRDRLRAELGPQDKT
jgi:hypothetical protein